MSCPFCDLDETRTRTLEEREFTRVIFSNPRLMPGHLLVIPKRHVEYPFDLTAEERKEIFDLTLEYQKKIIGTIAAGCDIRENCRPFIKQSRLKIDHIHFHLLPRDSFDAYHDAEKGIGELFQDTTEEEMEEVKGKLEKRT